MKLYHYTQVKSYYEIDKTRQLFPSYFSTAMDASGGEGWYLTDLPPHTSDNDLSTLWGQYLPERMACFLCFEVDNDFVFETRENIFRIPIETIPERVINLDKKYFDSRNQENIVIQYQKGGVRKPDYL